MDEATLYTIDEEKNELCVTDKREASKGEYIPKYVIHLYTPIFGAEGLGFWVVLCSMTSRDKSWNKLHDYCTMCRFGWKSLQYYLDIFIELGMIKVEKPSGEDRWSNKRTNIYVFDPPMTIPEKYVKDVLEKSIVREWMINSPEKELRKKPVEKPELDLFPELTLAPTEKPSKPRRATQLKKESDPLTSAILERYKSLLPAHRMNINWGLEGKAAKRLSQYAFKMGWSESMTLAAIGACWGSMEVGNWIDRVNLQIVFNGISQWVGRNPEYNTILKKASEEASYSEEDAIDLSRLHKHYKSMRPNDPDFWKVGTVLLCDGGTMICTQKNGRLLYVREQDNKELFWKQ